MHPPLLVPSILAGDHVRLADSAALVGTFESALDPRRHHGRAFRAKPHVWPGHRRRPAQSSKLFLDVHLMLDEPHRYIEAFARQAPASSAFTSSPATTHAAALARTRDLGCKNGIVLNPGTPAEAVEHLLAASIWFLS